MKNYRKAIVAIVADWDKPYLSEFVEWHRSLGFEKFVIMANNWIERSVEIDNPEGVEIYTIDGDVQQLNAYNAAMFYKLGDVDWAAFIDTDEFIHINTNQPLDEILAAHDDRELLCVNWRLFGSSGIKTFDGDYSVQKRFQRCSTKLDPYVKVFVNVAFRRANMSPSVFINPHFQTHLSWNQFGVEVNGFWSFTNLDKRHPLEVWHYAMKSEEEFLERRQHARADTGKVRRGLELEQFRMHYDRNDITKEQLAELPLAL